MGLLEKALYPFITDLPWCELCENFIEYERDKGICCNAYPDGVPKELNVYSDEMKTYKCSDKYHFKEKEKSE